MRLRIEADLDYFFPAAADVLLAIEAAALPEQRLLDDRLTLDGAEKVRPIAGEEGIGRRSWLRAEGEFRARYRATIEVNRAAAPIDALEIAPRRALEAAAVPYLWPSRYCEADRFETFVAREFGAIEGGAKVAAMAEWIGREMDYCLGSSDATTTAADAFVARRGVCRDYAHLLAAFARAAGIPARLVSAYAAGLEPPDFHAVVEVWLGGGWRLVDATGKAEPEALARICVGRDATDIAFLTSFGAAELRSQRVSAVRAEEGERR